MQLPSKNLLTEARLPRESIVLDLFFVRWPQNESDEELWSQLDEQVFSPELRQALAAQGFRAGVSPAHPPAKLEAMLNDIPEVDPTAEEGTVANLQAEPTVSRRHLQISPDSRAEIQVSRELPNISLLERSATGEVSGTRLLKAQGLFVAQASPEPDGRVRLALLPEIQHGDPRPEVVQRGTSHFLLETRRPRKTFDQLKLEAPLAPGEMLIVGGIDRGGSAGHHFFHDPAPTGAVRKLLVVRVSQTQHDPALITTGALAKQ